jgi:hypothetical protein
MFKISVVDGSKVRCMIFSLEVDYYDKNGQRITRFGEIYDILGSSTYFRLARRYSGIVFLFDSVSEPSSTGSGLFSELRCLLKVACRL